MICLPFKIWIQVQGGPTLSLPLIFVGNSEFERKKDFDQITLIRLNVVEWL
jgi:hypothetical protein